jgi:glycosyltransferase involved in cell wall biosynthesis
VSYSELSWLYSHASLFVFPSLDEGFGLPLVEAYFFNCPTIASDIAPFREINTAMHYFNPNSPSDIKNKMESAIFFPKLEVRESRIYDGSWKIPIQRIRGAI